MIKPALQKTHPESPKSLRFDTRINNLRWPRASTTAVPAV